MKNLTLICLLMTLWFVGCHKQRKEQSRSQQADWTLLFYTDADNDLEESSMNDLRQLLEVGSDSRVQLVMLCDRSELDSSEQGYSNERVFNIDDWSGAKLLHIRKQQLQQLDDWGEVNMADGATLERFLKTARQAFPAKNYALIIGDHGTGWEGACSDDSASDEDDQLTLSELQTALTGVENLRLVGFDCCSMATIETAHALRSSANVLVASQELEPLLGWDYRGIVGLLKEKPELQASDLAKIIVTTYGRSFDRSVNAEIKAEGKAITLSATDLSTMNEVAQALRELSSSVAKQLKKGKRRFWLTLAKARTKAEEYGDDSEAFDLHGFAKELSTQTEYPETATAAKTLVSLLEQSSIAKVGGPARPGAQGLTIFFPLSVDELESYQELKTWRDIGWAECVELFQSQKRESTRNLVSDLELSSDTVLEHEPVVLEAQLRDIEEIASLYLVLAEIDDGTTRVLGLKEIEIANELKLEWNGQWLSGSEGTTIPLWGELFYRVPAEIDEREVTLHLYNDQLVMATYEGNGGIRQLHLQPGDEIYPLYQELDEYGERTLSAQEDWFIEIESQDTLDIQSLPVETGEYQLGILAVDYEGRWNLETDPVRFGIASSSDE